MSDDGGTYQLPNILTNLAVRVGQLEGAVKIFMENWTAQDRLAHDSRRVVYERLELLGRQLDRIATDVNNMQQDIAELKKEVDEEVMPSIRLHDLAVERRLGAKGVWVLIGGAMIAAASGLAYVMDKIAAYIFPKP